MAKVVIPETLIDNLTKRQIIELDSCTRCGECVDVCPTTEVTHNVHISPMEKIATYRSFVKQTHGLRAKVFGKRGIPEEELQKFTQALYTCTVCGHCGAVCPVGIHCQELWPALRAKMVKMGFGPIALQKTLSGIVKDRHNPFNQPHERRVEWLTPDIKIAERAELAYYMGCGLHYVGVPLLQGSIRMINAAGIEFTALMGDEWDCGFPLYIIGETDVLADLINHNIDGLVKKGVKRVFTTCPCCVSQIRNVWPVYYKGGKFPLELVHSTEIVAEAIKEGRLAFRKSLKGKRVTYHDPCQLTRGPGEGSGVWEEPRIILKSLPGIDFVEIPARLEETECCGAGGGIRRAYADVASDVAMKVIHQAEDVDADILVTNCPACYERFPMAMATKNYTPKNNLRVVDIFQLAYACEPYNPQKEPA